MYNNQSFVAIIPARGGSKGIPMKNIINIGGKPLIQYTIDAALNSKYIDKIIISTDDRNIANVAEKCGVKVSGLRPKYLAEDTTKTIDVIIYELDKLQSNNEKFDYLVLLQPTSPLRNSNHIDEAINLLMKSSYKSLVSVCDVNENPVLTRIMRVDNSLERLLQDTNSTVRRQDFNKYYKVNGAIYINLLSEIKSKTSFNDNKLGYFMDKYSSIDIDEPEDLEKLEKILDKIALKEEENE